MTCAHSSCVSTRVSQCIYKAAGSTRAHFPLKITHSANTTASHSHHGHTKHTFTHICQRSNKNHEMDLWLLLLLCNQELKTSSTTLYRSGISVCMTCEVFSCRNIRSYHLASAKEDYSCARHNRNELMFLTKVLI